MIIHASLTTKGGFVDGSDIFLCFVTEQRRPVPAQVQPELSEDQSRLQPRGTPLDHISNEKLPFVGPIYHVGLLGNE